MKLDQYASPQIELWNALRNKILEADRKHPSQLPFIVGIGGAGCMGKSYFASEFASYPKPENAVLFDLDGYLIPKEERDYKKLTGYNKGAYNYKEAQEAFLSLLTKEHTTIRYYDHLSRKHYDVQVKNCRRRYTIIVVGVAANNASHFPPSKMFSLHVNFMPNSDDAYTQARFTVETGSRGRKGRVHDVDWQDRLSSHLGDFREYIDSDFLQSDIDVVVQRVSIHEWPYLSEIRLKSPSSIIVRRPASYSIESESVKIQPSIIERAQAALDLLPETDAESVSLRKEIQKDLDAARHESLGNDKSRSLLERIEKYLSKENIERGTLLFNLVKGVGEVVVKGL